MIPRKTAAFGFALALAACGPVPQPFRPETGAPPNPLLDLPDIPGIYVPPVEGTTLPMGKLLARSVAEALNDKDVPAYVNAPHTRRFLLVGRVAPQPDGTVEDVRWRLLDPQDQVVAEHAERVEGPAWRWEYGDPKLLRSIGLGVAAAFAPVARPDDPTLNAVDMPIFSVHVAPVEGAPGDGNASLRTAVRTLLVAEGLKVGDNPEAASAVLRGRVEMGPARNGAQPVRIVWGLYDAAGAKIGEAAQANAVPDGSLNGTWGETAGYAAQAAMEGILELARAARRGPAKAEARESPRRDLPQLPGRALPPPE